VDIGWSGMIPQHPGPVLQMAEWTRRNHQEKGSIMSHAVIHDVRGGFFLMAGLATLAFICTLAALSAVMRPARWADRKLV